MLEGLEATEIRLSQLERTKRIDAEYFKKHFLHLSEVLASRKTRELTQLVFVSDGNHFSIAENFTDEGIPYYRGQDVTGKPFVELSTPKYIDEKAFFEPHMKRSHLKQGDVLLSIVGTIGESSLVTSTQPATCSCKLAILRPKNINPNYLAILLQSDYGKSQIARLTRGAIQMGLLLEDMDQVLIPSFSEAFENSVSQAVKLSQTAIETSKTTQQHAEQMLLNVLGLENWQPMQALSYSRKASAVFTAERFDAEHYQEKYYTAKETLTKAGALDFVPITQLLTTLTNGHTPLHHNLTQGEVPFLCAEHVTDFEVHYNSEKKILTQHHQTELARTAVKENDVLLTIKGRVGNAAIANHVPGNINMNQDVALLRFNDHLPLWYIVSFLNSIFGKLQTEQMCTGAINPFLGLFNISKFTIPVFDKKIMQNIADKTQEFILAAKQQKQQSNALLEAAKRAVEMAIEESEEAAMAYLQPFIHSESGYNGLSDTSQRDDETDQPED